MGCADLAAASTLDGVLAVLLLGIANGKCQIENLRSVIPSVARTRFDKNICAELESVLFGEMILEGMLAWIWRWRFIR